MAVTRTRPERPARTLWAATSVPVTRGGKAMGFRTVEVTNRLTYCNLLKKPLLFLPQTLINNSFTNI